MARRKTFRKRGKKQSSRRRRSLKGKGFGSMMPSFNKSNLPDGYNACCVKNRNAEIINGKIGSVCKPECLDPNYKYYH